MANQVLSTVENNFTKGLVTEFTGLNFPENAATDTANCVYTLVGDVTRRQGIDTEIHGVATPGSRSNNAISTYKWNNAGGDGLTEIVVEQVGSTLFFYRSSSATTASPISTQLLTSLNFNTFTALGGSFDVTRECQYSDGNGYLFVYHPNCDPFYCTYNGGSIVSNLITIQIRDFVGLPDGLAINTRPSPALTNTAHSYNLTNQGWLSGNPWAATSTTSYSAGTLGTFTFTIQTGLTVITGQTFNLIYTGPALGHGLPAPGTTVATGTITGYTSGTGALVVNITSTITWTGTATSWQIIPVALGYINTFVTATGNYPSNADVWWYFKNASGVFDPATTLGNVTLSAGPAPKGHYVLSAFNQDRTSASGSSAVFPVVSTTVRPKTGCWFQGRVWYTGVDSSFPGSGIAPFSTWSENIYFSQVITDVSQFGNCYQQNDPTSETLFSLLPTDGGVIQIQGCGSIYKLFPLQNALLVFASNGVWYVTGSQGIGFSANDYTIVKLSAVKSISSTSFVDVNGLPMFWNEEGIYSVEPAKQGTSLLNSPLHVNPLEVVPLTVGTILSFFNNIPLQSKKYVRGVYNPIDYVVQWIYKTTNETSVFDRYTYDGILNFNNSNKAFFPYTLNISNTNAPSINGIIYVSSPGGSAAPNSVIKYVASNFSGFTFADEHDTNYVDWANSGFSLNYVSFFVTGFRLHGQGQRRFQIPYLYVFSRSDTNTSYKIQGLWDYATSGNSGRWSIAQLVNNWSPNFGMMFRRHRIRGQGIVLQIKVTSVDGQAFDLMGWSSFETQNTGV